MTSIDKDFIFIPMEIIKGISASPGIYIGKVFLYYEENLNIPKYEITSKDVKKETQKIV